MSILSSALSSLVVAQQQVAGGSVLVTFTTRAITATGAPTANNWGGYTTTVTTTSYPAIRVLPTATLTDGTERYYENNFHITLGTAANALPEIRDTAVVSTDPGRTWEVVEVQSYDPAPQALVTLRSKV